MVYWRLLQPVGVGGDQPLVGVDQQHERHAEDQLHARTPEAVELVFEHAQSVLDELVASPTQANVQQVQAERAAYGLANVEMDHLGRDARPAPGRAPCWPGRCEGRPARRLAQAGRLSPVGRPAAARGGSVARTCLCASWPPTARGAGGALDRCGRQPHARHHPPRLRCARRPRQFPAMAETAERWCARPGPRRRRPGPGARVQPAHGS